MSGLSYKRAIAKMQKVGIIAIVVVVIIAVIGGAYYTGLFSVGKPSTTIKNPDTVVVETYQPISILDPVTVRIAAETFVCWNVFDNLLSFRGNAPGGVTPMLGLAESWSVADDGMTWTFNIRHNAKFSNGDPLNTSAIVYNFNRFFTMNAANTMYLYEGILSAGCARAVDAYTLEIKTDIKFPPFLSLLCLWLGVLNPAVVEAHGGVQANTSNPQIATSQPFDGLYSGPYKVIEYVAGSGGHIKLEANPYYWGPQPKTKYIYIEWPAETSTRALKLESGDADWLWEFETTAVSQLIGAPGCVIDMGGLSETQAYIVFSGRDPLGMDANGILTRQALCYSFPYDSVITYAWGGYAKRAIGPIPQGVPGAYDAWTTTYNFNLTKAAELLDEAGHTPGLDGTRLSLEVDVGVGQDARMQACLIWGAQLQTIGVKLSIRQFVSSLLPGRMAANQTDMIGGAWFPDYPDPYHFAYSLLDSYSVYGCYGSYWKVPAIDDAILATLNEPNVTKRYELYRPILEMNAANPGRIYMLQEDALFIHRSWLQGYVYNPICHGMLWYLYKA
jgi:peptide/nickel transport system substrate-binding protein